MNKKLFLKLGLTTLVVASSLSFVACGQKNVSVGAINPSTVNTSNVENTAQNSVAESDKAIDSSEKTEQKAEQKSENTGQKAEKKSENIEKKAEQKTEDTKQKTNQKSEKTEQKAEQKPENIKEKTEGKTDNTEQKTEQYYYTLIEEAMQKQIDHINSIEDPQVRASAQSSVGAAVSKETELELKYPQDAEIIRASLSKVLEAKGV